MAVTAVVFSATFTFALVPPPSLVITGASLTGVTVIATVSVSFNWFAPLSVETTVRESDPL